MRDPGSKNKEANDGGRHRMLTSDIHSHMPLTHMSAHTYLFIYPHTEICFTYQLKYLSKASSLCIGS